MFHELRVRRRLEVRQHRESEPTPPAARQKQNRRSRTCTYSSYVDASEGLARQERLDFVDLGAERNIDTNTKDETRIGGAEIREHALGEDGIRDDDDADRKRAQMRRAPSEGLDVPLLSTPFDPDEVTRTKRLVADEVDTREEVRQRILKSERHCQRADSHGRQHRGQRHPNRVRCDQRDERKSENPSDGPPDSCRRAERGVRAAVGVYRLARHPHEQNDRKNREAEGQQMSGQDFEGLGEWQPTQPRADLGEEDGSSQRLRDSRRDHLGQMRWRLLCDSEKRPFHETGNDDGNGRGQPGIDG